MSHRLTQKSYKLKNFLQKKKKSATFMIIPTKVK